MKAQPLHIIDKWVERICLGLLYLGAVAIMLIILISLRDIVGNAIFGKPLSIGLDFCGLLLCAAVAFGIPYAQYIDIFTRITLLSDKAPTPVRFIIDVTVRLLVMLILGFLAYRSFILFADQLVSGIMTSTRTQLWPFSLMLAVNSAIGTLVALWQIIFDSKKRGGAA